MKEELLDKFLEVKASLSCYISELPPLLLSWFMSEWRGFLPYACKKHWKFNKETI